jgi:hypothetical protein
MHRFHVSLRRVLIVVVPVAAMVSRAVMSWGPANLIVLAAFVLIAAAGLACIPSIPYRLFWAGVAGFGSLYVAMLWLLLAISGLGNEVNPIHRGLIASHGTTPNILSERFDELGNVASRQRLIDSHIAAAHALTALILGIFGGCALLTWAKVRESRRWDRDALPELPLEDFLLPPLKIDSPLNSK